MRSALLTVTLAAGLCLGSCLAEQAEGPWLGIDLRAMVSDVVPGSPAELAGLQPGDLILTIGGVPLNEALDGSEPKQRDFNPGDEVVLEVLRAGETIELLARLGTVPPE